MDYQFNYNSANNNNNNNNSNIGNLNNESLQASGQQSSAPTTVEEITSGIDRMDVNMMENIRTFDNTNAPLDRNLMENLATIRGQQQHLNNQDIDYQFLTDFCRQEATQNCGDENEYNVVMMATEDGFDDSNLQNFGHNTQSYLPLDSQQQQQQQQQQRQTNSSSNINQGNANQNRNSNANNSCSDILIVTNVDSSVFQDKLVQSKFEALFLAYDPNVTFRYLKSFRRVRLDFNNSQMAEMARNNLNEYTIGNTQFRCYSAQIIKPNNNNNADNQNNAPNNNNSSRHLNIPKLTKQFLISPPASPPVGWEPVNEGSPCIDVQLISAIANLVPGKVHEIHPGNESQPGIFVEVCEEAQFGNVTDTGRGCPRIPRTMSPGQAVVSRP